LIDGMDASRGPIRSGGDSGAGNFQSPPPTQAPLALFSGIVEVAADGTAEVPFEIPAFNGTIRVMAVAWTPTKVGHASVDVIARDPVVIAGTLPRFLGSGDQSRLRLDLLNAEAVPGDYSLAVTVDGPITADPALLHQTVSIGAVGSRTPVNIPITASGIGTVRLTALLVGPGDVQIDQSFTLGVVPSNPPVTRRMVHMLEPNGGITVSKDLIAEMVAGTGAVSLSVGPLSALDVPGLLRDLDRYPYGCSEQIVSRAMPLLYLSELGGNDLDLEGSVKDRLSDTVQRLLARQDSNGAFGLWNSYSGDLWLSSFVTDFLLRAREKGFAVPEGALNQAVDYLRNQVGNSPYVQEGKGEDVAYALYTLARAGRAPAGDLKYFADTKIGQFGTAMARAQIAAALGMLGDRPRANAAFQSAADILQSEADGTVASAWGYYGSPLRDAAAIVALAENGNAGPPVIQAALKVITDERAKSRYASTQEMTWMVLAARNIVEQARAVELDVDGSAHQGAFYKVYQGAALDQAHKVSNLGATPLQAVVAVSGAPIVPEPESFNGMSLGQNFYTLDGKPVDPTQVEQNTRLVVVLTASRDGNDQTGNFLLVDRLPAGFEIENPTLVETGSTASLSWLTDLTGATYTEFRDDRFVAAFTDQSAKLAYVVRAVAPGQYTLPGATVEDMYRPERNATLATTTIRVIEK
jgi:uncharacterized protein YfaS (alpha-2-macroglobulin family)